MGSAPRTPRFIFEIFSDKLAPRRPSPNKAQSPGDATDKPSKIIIDEEVTRLEKEEEEKEKNRKGTSDFSAFH